MGASGSPCASKSTNEPKDGLVEKTLVQLEVRQEYSTFPADTYKMQKGEPKKRNPLRGTMTSKTWQLDNLPQKVCRKKIIKYFGL